MAEPQSEIAIELPMDLVWELAGPERPLRMTELPAFVNRLRQLELALFAWLGGAAPAAGEPAVVAWASAASLRAAWRATQLETLLPVSTGLPPPVGTPPGPALRDGLADLARHRQSPGSARLPEEVRVWYLILEGAYSFRLEHLSPASDGQLERSLRRVLRDLKEEQATAAEAAKLHGRNA